MKLQIVACGVFRSALEHLNIQNRFPNITIEYLKPFLHHYPLEIRNQVDQSITKAHAKECKVICLYGKCFPDIDKFLKERVVARLGCESCYEMLMGPRAFHGVLNKRPGTYFMEKEIIMNFDRDCQKPLELDDPEVKKWFFEQYHTMLYIRQPGDPDLQIQTARIAEFLHLQLQTHEADYSELAKRLENEIKKNLSSSSL